MLAQVDFTVDRKRQEPPITILHNSAMFLVIPGLVEDTVANCASCSWLSANVISDLLQTKVPLDEVLARQGDDRLKERQQWIVDLYQLFEPVWVLLISLLGNLSQELEGLVAVGIEEIVTTIGSTHDFFFNGKGFLQFFCDLNLRFETFLCDH